MSTMTLAYEREGGKTRVVRGAPDMFTLGASGVLVDDGACLLVPWSRVLHVSATAADVAARSRPGAW